jgi:hypothetical protein
MRIQPLIRCILAPICALLWSTGMILAGDAPGTVSVNIPVGNYEVKSTLRGHEITVDDFGYLLIPGKPVLPSRVISIAIPPGTEISGVEIDRGGAIELGAAYEIPPAPLPRVLGQENKSIYENERRIYQENYDSIYGEDDLYPENNVEFLRTAGYRKYNLVDIRVTPFSYRPLSGALIHYPEISIDIHYKTSDQMVQVMLDDLERTEETAEEIIINYVEARSWYPVDMGTDEDFHDFVIITTSSLLSSLTALIDWETQKGRNVEAVTTSWIDANYGGYDLAEKIRNFLREKYPSAEWGIEDVLIIGHYDDVPMRRVWLDLGYGKPETDYYYAELSFPDNQSWDIDGDRLYGEETDYNDFYTEVNVGRIPWSDPGIVRHICEKSVAFEQNNDPAFKKNILLLGAFFWDDDPHPRTDCAILMEAKIDQPWMSGWTKTRMYEEGYSNYRMDYDLRHDNVVSVWSSEPFAFVNYAGHGSPISSHRYHNGMEAFIESSDCPLLNDDYPAIVFADACSNSDTDHLNIGQAMMGQGAVGFLGATKVARGCPGWDDPLDGSSQSLDYFFTTAVTSGEYTQGQAHQRALRLMYTYGLWYNLKYEMFEWGALWGNPNLGMASPESRPLTILFPDGLPEYIEPGAPTTITVRIEDGGENYLPGSGALNYSLDGGDFLTADLESVGDDLYQAILPPADCDDLPEYYVSAYGDLGSLVTSPSDAPVSCYDVGVGAIVDVFHDDFESDLGWTVHGDASAGHWERGIPIGGGERGDPEADYDGSGRCFVTGNQPGDSDVDAGFSYLTSPIVYLYGAEQVRINYALWYTNNFGDNPNRDLFRVYISSDGGSGWTLAETVGPGSSNGWEEHSIDVPDSMTSTGIISVQFEVSDLDEGSVVEAGIDAFDIQRLDCEFTSILDPVDSNLPSDFDLLGGYPNPFNSSMTIGYALPVPSHVKLAVYDLLGRAVAVLVDAKQQAGYHQVVWNPENSSSGLYFYRLSAGEYSESERMILLK